jgi:NADPH:quinone reductase-like Zn-dependent oxidoreductase
MIPGGPVPPPFLLGWDFAGEVVAIGERVDAYAVGDLVVGMVPWFLTRGAPGAYAELIAADEEWIVALPAGLSAVQAATVPLNALTAYQIMGLLDLAEGEPVLVVGASGAVGGFATQLLARAGHSVLAVANDEDQEWVGGLGANTVIPRSAGPAAQGRVRKVVDAVPVGPPAVEAVEDGGIVVITRPTEPIDPARQVRQRLVLIDPVRETLRALIADVAAGWLLTRVAAEVPLAEAAHAHRMVEAKGLRGKIVLVP